MRLKILAALLAAFSLTCGSARADITSVVFADSFVPETALYNPAGNPWGTLNFTKFQNWNVTAGSVDLVNTGGVYPSIWFHHGVVFNPSFTFVDLDGTTGHSGEISMNHKLLLQPGQYHLSFDLAGNQGRDPAHHYDGVTARINGLGISQHYEMAWNDPFTTKGIDFSVDTPTYTSLTFTNETDAVNAGSLNDNQGPLLANISLTSLTGGTIANVPEGSAILLLLGAGASLLFVRRFTQRPAKTAPA
jgi:hypothetical protein